jgi:hypothetical protein
VGLHHNPYIAKASASITRSVLTAYKFCARYRDAIWWVLDRSGQIDQAFNEFKRRYGLQTNIEPGTHRYFAMLANVRMALFKDRKQLRLSTNPLLDDLCIVFADWLTQRQGFERLQNTDVSDRIRKGMRVGDFSFPV